VIRRRSAYRSSRTIQFEYIRRHNPIWRDLEKVLLSQRGRAL
jgi:L-rhamnose mutarotase